MKCQILFSRINETNIFGLLSAEYAHDTVSVNNKSIFEGHLRKGYFVYVQHHMCL